MGRVISLDERRRAKGLAVDPHGQGFCAVAPPRRSARPAATFWFDLTSPATYLAAERADRGFADLRWRPTTPVFPLSHDTASTRRIAATRAADLGMPFAWPEGPPPTARAVMRVAAWASGVGHCGPFVVAAGRLAYCGGFHLDDPALLAEAATAAGLPLPLCLDAAEDPAWDDGMAAAGRALRARGVTSLPVLTLGPRLFCGEEALTAAAHAARSPSAPAGRAPVAR